LINLPDQLLTFYSQKERYLHPLSGRTIALTGQLIFINIRQTNLLKTIFNPTEFYHLEDHRVHLRPLGLQDFEPLLIYATAEQELWDYSVSNPAGPDGLTQYLEEALAGRQSGREYPLLIFDKMTQEVAGSTRFHQINTGTGCLQIGYTWLGRKFHGTGLNRHCKYLMLQFAFDTLGFHRVELRADHQNARSIQALKSMGCIEEGVMRGNGIRHDGQRRDTIVFSILKHEWEGHVKTSLEQRLNAGCYTELVA